MRKTVTAVSISILLSAALTGCATGPGTITFSLQQIFKNNLCENLHTIGHEIKNDIVNHDLKSLSLDVSDYHGQVAGAIDMAKTGNVKNKFMSSAVKAEALLAAFPLKPTKAQQEGLRRLVIKIDDTCAVSK